MITREKCVKIFNASINNNPISFQNDLLPLVSDYLIKEIKCEKENDLITFIINNPSLITLTIPTLIDHYTKKFNICSIYLNKNNFEPFLYY